MVIYTEEEKELIIPSGLGNNIAESSNAYAMGYADGYAAAKAEEDDEDD